MIMSELEEGTGEAVGGIERQRDREAERERERERERKQLKTRPRPVQGLWVVGELSYCWRDSSNHYHGKLSTT